MFVHRLLHVLLNYSYIAILYSICRCTVQNVCPKKKNERQRRGREGKKKKDSLHCQSDQMGLKEKQGATESIGNCRNWWVLSGRLFSSVPLLLRSTSLCILTWSIIIGWKKKSSIHQRRLKPCLCVRPNMAARGPAVNCGATNLHCLRWSSDERWKGKKNKLKNHPREQKKTGQRTRCWYMQTQWHRFGKG